MKQLIFIPKITTLDDNCNSLNDLSSLPKHSFGVFSLMPGYENAFDGLTAPWNVAFAYDEGNGPRVFPEVDLKTLTVSVAKAAPAVRRKVVFTVPSTMTSGYGKFATVIITKCGTVLNERNNFSFTVPVNANSTPTLIAGDLATAIMNNVNGMQYDTELLVNATASGATLTIESTDDHFNFNVTLADELINVPFDTSSCAEFVAPILDAKYIKELMHKCRGGKGYQHADCKAPWELYPGENYHIDDELTYGMITFRFAVPRDSAKQRDEVVYQTVHVVAPYTSESTGGSTGLTFHLADLFKEFLVDAPVQE